jgi:hypothetical protein
MKFNEYLKEEVDRNSPEFKLLIKFFRVHAKAEKIVDQMFKMDDELEKIQKAMKKKGIDELVNLKGQVVFDLNTNTSDKVFSMVNDR